MPVFLLASQIRGLSLTLRDFQKHNEKRFIATEKKFESTVDDLENEIGENFKEVESRCQKMEKNIEALRHKLIKNQLDEGSEIE